MLEGLAMLTVLAGMGFYFVKSTDLPKDMRDRSAQSKMNSPLVTSSPKKYAFPQVEIKNLAQEEKEKKEAVRLSEIEKQIKRQSLIALQNQKIDELTLLITTLELEIKENNEKNAEIQKQIDVHMEALRVLKETQIA